MGMTGGTVWWGVNEHVKWGIATYGATRGERGGFITLGVSGELEHRWSPQWHSTLGLHVGAGGGHGGQPLAGGGLMLRTDVGLGYATKDWGRIGAGVSHVRFPDGTISSTQPYLRYDYRFHSLLVGGYAPLESHANAPALDALAARGQSLGVVARDVQMAARPGLAKASRMQLVGVEWSTDLDDHWFLKLQADGAMGGQSSGYMQILAGGGYRLPLWQGGAVLLHAAIGPAGGGAVETQGGLIWDTGVTLQQRISRHDSLALAWGKEGGVSGPFAAHSWGLKWVHQFSSPIVGPAPVRVLDLAGWDSQHLRIRWGQHIDQGSNPAWRNGHTDQAVHNLGAQLDYFVSPAEDATQWFVTGQGMAAYKGQAGAFMSGLLGMGVHRALTGAWFAEAQALVGAAGGGGLVTGGGLVGQYDVGLGYRLSPQWSIMTTAGRIAARQGSFQAKVWGVALVYDLTTLSR